MKYLIFQLLCATIFLNSCSESSESNDSGNLPLEPVISADNKVFIQDRTGKRWDVTHARDTYGFQPDLFQFGLGPFAIKPLNNPVMCKPGEQGYPAATSDQAIIGVQIGQDVHGYPLHIMRSVEVVNTTMDSQAVAPAYCPLIGLTAVYSREIDGRKLTLSASGWTYADTFVLYDYQTESLWYQLPGTTGLTCISGTYADRKLPAVTSDQISWSKWVTNHPGSWILKTTESGID